jgi:bifunctional UDP-N-acetylglucosamine pyrophosphorylase/glucosamine-1-phosphate N-acetyltransferase
MQALIMAAGRGTRMKELTESTPKSMLTVAGRTLLEYKFDALPDDVDEIILVVGYLGGMILERFGPEYAGKRLLYVEQENPVAGTADALWQAKDILKDRFLVMNGDNLYAPKDIAACTEHEWAVVVQKTDSIRTGSVEVKNGRAMKIVENTDHQGGAGFACTNLFMLDTRIFTYKPIPKAVGSSELGLPQTMMQAAKDIEIAAIVATWWFEIKDPEDLKKAEAILAS